MKIPIFHNLRLLPLVLISFVANAQSNPGEIESLKKRVRIQGDDTAKVNMLIGLSKSLANSNTDSALYFSNTAIALATKLDYKMGIADSKVITSKLMSSILKYSEGTNYINDALAIYKGFLPLAEAPDKKNILFKIADCYNIVVLQEFPQGNYPEALKFSFLELTTREQIGDKQGICNAEFNIGNIYYCQHNYAEALKHDSASLKIGEQLGDKANIAGILGAIGLTFFEQGNYEEASNNYYTALKLQKELADSFGLAETDVNIGVLLDRKEKYGEALKFDFEALKIYERFNIPFNIPYVLNNIAAVYMKQKKYDEAAGYLTRALSVANETKHLEYIKLTYENLATFDSLRGDYKRAWNDYRLAITYRDSLLNIENTRKITRQQMQYEFDKKDAVAREAQDKKDDEARRVKVQQYFAIAILALVVLAVAVIAVIQFKSKRHKQKANLLLQEEKQKVEQTLLELKSTQAQLIQSEKMASLGELTAGIAHEIQNPLNFVNNFSEVNRELIGELVNEVDKGNTEEIKLIASDIKENSEKINYHGKRADAIVKGMLQHSRSSTGQKEPTDINSLCDEYLRLAYHGLRAKDNSFNAKIETDFDPTIEKINIVPQDIGRALLNIISNAFYAAPLPTKGGFAESQSKHIPTVTVKTSKNPPLGGRGAFVEIKVSDNGPGIPANILDKIFQPFFTTKPTGQGTGLGLSLSYDIITKGHGGELKVETNEGEGTTFIIRLPGK